MIQLWEQTAGLGQGRPASSSSRGCSHELARTYAKLEAMRLMNWKLTAAVARRRPCAARPPAPRRPTAPRPTSTSSARSPRCSAPAAGSVPGRPAPCCTGRSSSSPARASSTRSAAGSTRCCATWSRPRASGCRGSRMTAESTRRTTTRLAAFVGRTLQDATPAADPVNVPMIRHWVEAMGDANPIHLDDEAARATAATARRAGDDDAGLDDARLRPHGRPPTGPARSPSWSRCSPRAATPPSWPPTPTSSSTASCVPGDHVSVEEVVESISPGEGDRPGRRPLRHHAQDLPRRRRRASSPPSAGARCASARGRRAGAEAPAAPARAQPRQRVLVRGRHASTGWSSSAAPPARRCATRPGPSARSASPSSGTPSRPAAAARSTRCVVAHHPRHPAFDYPLLVAVVELEEGTRLITNLTGVSADDLAIGMPLESWTGSTPTRS